MLIIFLLKITRWSILHPIKLGLFLYEVSSWHDHISQCGSNDTGSRWIWSLFCLLILIYPLTFTTTWGLVTWYKYHNPNLVVIIGFPVFHIQDRGYYPIRTSIPEVRHYPQLLKVILYICDISWDNKCLYVFLTKTMTSDKKNFNHNVRMT